VGSLATVVPTLVELVVAPALAALSTLAARRWGTRVGGVVSAFPAIVGPVLLITALEHGPVFAAQAANGTLLGLVALSAFALAYGRAAAHRGWLPSLAAGWACAAFVAVGVGVGIRSVELSVGALVAVLSLIIAHRVLPAGQSKSSANSPPAPPAQSALWRREIPLRMAVTVLLVSSLSAEASRLGPMLGGMLAALPVLASVLAVFTHREHGAAALIALLRGMLAGMAGFVAFCEIVAALIVHDGIVPAFAAATVAAMIVQMITAYAPGSRPSLEPSIAD
jgi:hypothetical protein